MPDKPFGYVDDAEVSQLTGISQQALFVRFLQAQKSGVHVAAHKPTSDSINSYSAEFLHEQFPHVDWWAARSFFGPGSGKKSGKSKKKSNHPGKGKPRAEGSGDRS